MRSHCELYAWRASLPHACFPPPQQKIPKDNEASSILWAERAPQTPGLCAAARPHFISNAPGSRPGDPGALISSICLCKAPPEREPALHRDGGSARAGDLKSAVWLGRGPRDRQVRRLSPGGEDAPWCPRSRRAPELQGPAGAEPVCGW